MCKPKAKSMKIFQLFTYSGGNGQGISLSGPISPTTLSLIANQKMTAAPLVAASVQPTQQPVGGGGGGGLHLVASTGPQQLTLPPVSSVVTAAAPRGGLAGGVANGGFITAAGTAVDENINYDLISPMLAAVTTTTAATAAAGVDLATAVNVAKYPTLIEEGRCNNENCH